MVEREREVDLQGFASRKRRRRARGGNGRTFWREDGVSRIQEDLGAIILSSKWVVYC